MNDQLIHLISKHLDENRKKIHRGHIVDASVISAPRWIKNKENQGDMKLHQTKKGSNWYLGYGGSHWRGYGVRSSTPGAWDCGQGFGREDDRRADAQRGAQGFSDKDYANAWAVLMLSNLYMVRHPIDGCGRMNVYAVALRGAGRAKRPQIIG